MATELQVDADNTHCRSTQHTRSSCSRFSPALYLITIALLAHSSCAQESSSGYVGPILTTCSNNGAFECVYTTMPDVTACVPGVLSEHWQDLAVRVVNDVRAYAELPPIQSAGAEHSVLAKCALISAANLDVSLSPSMTASCYTSSGADTCARSNISLYQYGLDTDYLQLVPSTLFSPEDIVRSWIIDDGEPSLGHRRALLNPFLSETALGMAHHARLKNGLVHVDQAVALLVQPRTDDIPLRADAPQFVAWPKGKTPLRWFPLDARLSLSVIHDRQASVNNAAVSFKDATIRITDATGHQLPATDITEDYNYYGVPNQVAWSVPGLAPNIQYEVDIDGVIVLATTRSYTYTFTLDSAN